MEFRQTPYSRIEKNDNELVHSKRNNPSSTSIPISEILWQQFPNYSNYGEEIAEESVQKLRTIYLTSEGRKVLDYIKDNTAFTVPTLRLEIKVKKRTAYDILDKLRPWVEKSKYTINHPNPRTRGPHPHVWLVMGTDEVKGVEEARKQYNALQWRFDPELKHREKLKGISESIAHQLFEKRVSIGNPDEILELIKKIPVDQLNPSDRPIVVKQVFAILREKREGRSH